MSYTRTGWFPDAPAPMGTIVTASSPGKSTAVGIQFTLRKQPTIEITKAFRHSPIYNPRPRRNRP